MCGLGAACCVRSGVCGLGAACGEWRHGVALWFGPWCAVLVRPDVCGLGCAALVRQWCVAWGVRSVGSVGRCGWGVDPGGAVLHLQKRTQCRTTQHGPNH